MVSPHGEARRVQSWVKPAPRRNGCSLSELYRWGFTLDSTEDWSNGWERWRDAASWRRKRESRPFFDNLPQR